MKLRIDNATYGRLSGLSSAVGFSRAEIVRRCLRWWVNRGRPRVEKRFFAKTATRQYSESYDMDLGAFETAFSHRTIMGVVRKRLDMVNWNEIDAQATYEKELEEMGEANEAIIIQDDE